MNKSKDIKIWLSLLVYATAILFVISPDSYTHDLLGHVDSSVFFMCGKAWMNGMIPYVDFADSKGPLLWLITGVAYLISPYDYVGVFWLTCLCFSITFFLYYKIGTLLTDSHRLGYIVSLLMAFPCLVFGWEEMKSEMWCHPLIAASLYCLLREILRPSDCTSYTAGVVFGFTFMATLLIKWSIAVMSLSFAVSCLWLLLHRKVPCKRYCFNFVLSAVALFFPFLIYMIATDSFHAFVFEYFLNTGATVGESGIQGFLSSYIQDIIRLSMPKRQLLYVVYLVGIFIFYRYRRSVTLHPLLCGIVFLAISIKHNKWGYYTIIDNTFAIFLVALVINICHKRAFSGRKITLFEIASVYIATIIVISGDMGYYYFRRETFFFQDKERKAYYDAAWLMGQRKNPTIMIIGNAKTGATDTGIGMPVNALPGCVYWTHQNGATGEMKKLRWQSVKKKEPDFIIIVLNANNGERERVLRAGYHYYLTADGREIYGRKGLKMPPKDFKVSNMDILLKRKIKFGYEN